MRNNIVIFFLFAVTLAFGQNNSKKIDTLKTNSIDSSLDLSAQINLSNGELKLGTETKRIVSDSLFRKKIYPKEYSFKDVTTSMDENNILRAIWQLINLYEKQPKLSGSIFLQLVSSGITHQHILNSFYSYIALDTEVADYTTGVPIMINPEIVDFKMNTVKKIIEFIIEHKNKN
jgi:hypothetical protein